jgi:hypothetical protein
MTHDITFHGPTVAAEVILLEPITAPSAASPTH